ncbi:molybdate ABC transporter substrate-binding protein [Anaerobacillus alkaliphilus]|uniref:Molybdate ABC transporter substrate-binding protein n=2 Tax=Anaerobacillus alkaliphilus TaxID=1548597 RepID=A0A4Q0VU93_9BACI|nr:molybdate ABC transporter substrate-binding protein [Anaerobacillus alkaliphilus]
MKNKSFIGLYVAFCLVVIISGCATVEKKPELHIAAASNLVQAFTELGEEYEKETNVKIVFSFGSSGQLTEQILNGAPFDIFAPASPSFYRNFHTEALLDDQPVFALGRIGVATLREQDFTITKLEDLLDDAIIKVAIANPEHAPYGLAAKQALEQAGIWDDIEEKLVYGRNISDTFTLLETGNVEAAFIALSLKDEKVNFMLIDDHMHEVLEQPISVLSTTKYQEEARQFIEFLFSEEAQIILEKYGYSIP